MSIFNNQRLMQDTLNLDLVGLRRGDYADKYFENVRTLLNTLAAENYAFAAESPRLPQDVTDDYEVGDAIVEMQIFTRRAPYALVGGVDVALEMLRYCAGEFDEDGQFVLRFADLEVEAIQDGMLVAYGGDPADVKPVLKIRGPYRVFAHLETPILGYLTRISRIATNVYHTLIATAEKPLLFFPARFDLPSVQAADGYAYHLAVERYDYDYQAQAKAYVSTDAQGRWWGGAGGGTVPHALIASFLANTAEAMVQYARTLPASVPRIALVDFENDCIKTSTEVAHALFVEYRRHKTIGNHDEAEKYRLDGVRLDTGSKMIDRGLEPVDDPALNFGVNPRLVRAVRLALDTVWQEWDIEAAWQQEAQQFCETVKIVVTGGFDAERIRRFEAEGVPVDTYGVGSRLMANDSDTNTDFSADVVRVKIGDTWYNMAKVGRQICDNPDLEPVQL